MGTGLAPGLSRMREAPRVLSVGDAHVNSYGTWRDAEGRLCWGIDDFDEAWPLPYTNDLVRLATSVKLARKLGYISLRTKMRAKSSSRATHGLSSMEGARSCSLRRSGALRLWE